MEEAFVLVCNDGRKRKFVKVICEQCGKSFDKRQSFVLKSSHHFCSCQCKAESRQNRIEVECYHCGQKVLRRVSAVKKAKHGIHFCSRKCKEYEQSFEGNCDEIKPPHYNNGTRTYRDKAIRHYGFKCNFCDYDTKEVVVVHHIDKNRDNNTLSNLLVVCPTHHAEIHYGLRVVSSSKSTRIVEE